VPNKTSGNVKIPERIDKEVKEHSISKDAGFIYRG